MEGVMPTTTFSGTLQKRSTSCHLAAAALQHARRHRPRLSCQRLDAHAGVQLRQRRNTASAALDSDVGPHPSGENERFGENPSNFQRSLWGDFFLNYPNPDASSSQQKWIEERAHKLKEEVAKIVASSSTCSLLQQLHLIYELERLCLDHIFKDEIDHILTQINGADVSGCDLHTVAMWFYLLRKHRYMVSPDVFEKFQDEEGCFRSNNSRDLLSLYNAAHLRTHGERILDEAISSSKTKLELIMACAELEGSMTREIKFALSTPLLRRVRIFEAKYFISIYEKETSMTEMILEIAKLNFNHMQLHYRQELKIITSLWKDLQLGSNLSFARERIIECYFGIVAVYYEPCYSRARIILAMVAAIVTILDDIYDVYGTSEECELFTKCIESWDTKATENLPKDLKLVFGKILDTYRWIEDELTPGEKYRMSYLKKVLIDVVRGFNTEVKWRDESYVPATVEEHLHVSARTSGCHVLSCTSFVGLGDIATVESFEWVSSYPKMVRSVCTIMRLSNDLKSYERERKSSHVASTIDSCMKEHSVSMESACEKLQALVEESWQDFNREWLKPDNAQPKQLLDTLFNLARALEFTYKQGDALTNSEDIKDTIKSLFVEPIMTT